MISVFGSQEAAAQALGVGQATISRWRGQDFPPRWFAKYGRAISDRGINPEYIRTGEGPVSVDRIVQAIQDIKNSVAALEAVVNS